MGCNTSMSAPTSTAVLTSYRTPENFELRFSFERSWIDGDVLMPFGKCDVSNPPVHPG